MKYKYLIINSQGKKVKTITIGAGANLWTHYNKYCKSKGYTQKIESNKYMGMMAWSNGTDTLEVIQVL